MKIIITLLLCIGSSAMANNWKDYKKPDSNMVKSKLTDLQFKVTQKDATETAFKNKYWDNKEEGIYVDLLSGEPLFSSTHKYKSGTGWPSFWQAIDDEFIKIKKDWKLIYPRSEIRSTFGKNHLGHVFNDGPEPTGKRYCMNSAALKFIAKDKMKELGYEKYLPLFARAKTTESIATFAGGCFWCMEPPFEQLDGVSTVISGYMGGSEKNPTYKQVSSGSTGHAEVIQITYDPKKVTYEKLLQVFWKNVDPTQVDGQFVDKGKQYRTAIFYHSPEQKTAAELAKEKLGASKKFTQPIATEVTSAGEFYKAEDYHQDYYKINPVRYKFYRFNSGRDQFLDKLWKK